MKKEANFYMVEDLDENLEYLIQEKKYFQGILGTIVRSLREWLGMNSEEFGSHMGQLLEPQFKEKKLERYGSVAYGSNTIKQIETGKENPGEGMINVLQKELDLQRAHVVKNSFNVLKKIKLMISRIDLFLYGDFYQNSVRDDQLGKVKEEWNKLILEVTEVKSRVDEITKNIGSQHNTLCTKQELEGVFKKSIRSNESRELIEELYTKCFLRLAEGKTELSELMYVTDEHYSALRDFVSEQIETLSKKIEYTVHFYMDETDKANVFVLPRDLVEAKTIFNELSTDLQEELKLMFTELEVLHTMRYEKCDCPVEHKTSREVQIDYERFCKIIELMTNHMQKKTSSVHRVLNVQKSKLEQYILGKIFIPLEKLEEMLTYFREHASYLDNTLHHDELCYIVSLVEKQIPVQVQCEEKCTTIEKLAIYMRAWHKSIEECQFPLAHIPKLMVQLLKDHPYHQFLIDFEASGKTYSNSHLAELAGVSVPVVRNMKRPMIMVSPLSTYQKVYDALGVSLSDTMKENIKFHRKTVLDLKGMYARKN